MTSHQTFPILSASMHPSQLELPPWARWRLVRVGVFMVGLTAAIALQCAVWGANPVSYNAALQDAQKQQRPLLVLVGASWCPGCQTMKTRVIPSLAKRGGLKGVSFATVDTDAEAETAKQLMRGGSIPQLIVFSRMPDGR